MGLAIGRYQIQAKAVIVPAVTYAPGTFGTLADAQAALQALGVAAANAVIVDGTTGQPVGTVLTVPLDVPPASVPPVG